jgi:Aldehyde dehydrogenase family
MIWIAERTKALVLGPWLPNASHISFRKAGSSNCTFMFQSYDGVACSSQLLSPPQPLGVIGILSPWNYPAGLCLMPLATAIAAGNRAMVKPSEFTPKTLALMAAMLSEIFSEEEVAVVTDGSDVGAAFSALPFDISSSPAAPMSAGP